MAASPRAAAHKPRRVARRSSGVQRACQIPPPPTISSPPSTPSLPAPQLAAGISTDVTNVTRPVPVVTDAAGTPLANCKSVAANLNHTLFLTTDGSIYAAGRNGCESARADALALDRGRPHVPPCTHPHRCFLCLQMHA
jgi:hypothetical protein